MKDLSTIKAQLLSNPDTAHEYEVLEQEFRLIRERLTLQRDASRQPQHPIDRT